MNSTVANRDAITQPLISIVIACYSAGATLAATLDSIVSQNRDDIEIIIVDGGSTDDTMAIVQKYGDKIAWSVSEPDKGIYDAWNKGLRAARGNYISFVGADDVLLPDAIDAYVRQIALQPDAEYISSRVQYGEGRAARIIGRPWRWEQFNRYMTVAHVGSMHRRSLFDRLGPYNDSFRITGDYELLLRAGPDLLTAYIPNITVRMGVDGISSGQSNKVFCEADRAKRMHSGLPGWQITAQRWLAITKHRIRHLGV